MGATVNRGEIIHARRGVCWRARYARVLVVAHADGESGWLSVYLSCNFLCKTLAGPVRFASPLALDTRYHTDTTQTLFSYSTCKYSLSAPSASSFSARHVRIPPPPPLSRR